MEYTSPGRMKTVGVFRDHLRAIDPALDCDLDLAGADGPLGASIEVDGRRIGNRFAVHPMEGWDGTADGLPTEYTLRRWRRFGTSGAKLIWGGEAVAVTFDGRANPNQLYLNPDVDVAGALSRLLETLKSGHRDAGFATDDLLAGLQLTHSGRFSHPDLGPPAPRPASRHPVLDEKFGLHPSPDIVSDEELRAIGERFVALAAVARRAGFDFVDVKCCHGYLLHELLGARGREGRYGGSFENRTRLFVEIVEGIRSACPDLMVAARVSITDLYPFFVDPDTGAGAPRGLEDHLPYEHAFGVDPHHPLRPDLREPLRFLGLMRDLGIRMVNVTVGSPYYSAHIQRPAAYPPSDGYRPPEDPLCGVALHLQMVRACKQAFPDLVLVGSGYSYLQEHLAHVAQHEVRSGHVDLVGMGRMMLAYPELAADVLAGRPLKRKRICRTFSDCTTAPRNGMPSGCYPLDEHYRDAPEARQVRIIRRKSRAAGRSDA